MGNHETIVQQIKRQGILPLFYHDDAQVCVDVVQALYAAGIRCVEFTNRGKAALDNFKALIAARDRHMKGLLLSVGTIRTEKQAADFLSAGADFLISPVFDASIQKVADQNNVLWIPGCMTPTEIHVAENAGCTLIKLFPGNVLGPGFVAAIKTLFPAVDFIPTGGVEPDKANLEAWFASGVCAVGIGSKLISKKLLNAKEYKRMQEFTKQVLHIIQSLKR